MDAAARRHRIDGFTLGELDDMGVVYVDKEERIMVPPMLWHAVAGSDLRDVLGVDDAVFGAWLEPDYAVHAGKAFEDRVALGLTLRANLPFAKFRASQPDDGAGDTDTHVAALKVCAGVGGYVFIS